MLHSAVAPPIKEPPHATSACVALNCPDSQFHNLLTATTAHPSLQPV
jgi:hypothetical protein